MQNLSKQLNPAQLQKLNQVLPPLVSLMLVLAISYTMASLAWLLMPSGKSTHNTSALRISPGMNNQSSANQSDAQVNTITRQHLFGEYEQVATKQDTADAPDTRLNLVLRGILADTPMENASAIISIGRRGEEMTYGIGDKVSGASVKEIHADRVILERNGQFETLRMPKEFNSLINTSSATNSPAPRMDTPGSVIGEIRAKILRNPTSFGEYAIPVPYNENGRLRGYKLQPQGDRSLFDQLGLDPNDVILAVNGVPLNNPAKGITALRRLQRAKEIDLKVLRNGAEIPLHFEIP